MKDILSEKLHGLPPGTKRGENGLDIVPEKMTPEFVLLLKKLIGEKITEWKAESTPYPIEINPLGGRLFFEIYLDKNKDSKTFRRKFAKNYKNNITLWLEEE